MLNQRSKMEKEELTFWSVFFILYLCSILVCNVLESTQSCDAWVFKTVLRLRIAATSIQNTSLVSAGMGSNPIRSHFANSMANPSFDEVSPIFNSDWRLKFFAKKAVLLTVSIWNGTARRALIFAVWVMWRIVVKSSDNRLWICDVIDQNHLFFQGQDHFFKTIKILTQCHWHSQKFWLGGVQIGKNFCDVILVTFFGLVMMMISEMTS